MQADIGFDERRICNLPFITLVPVSAPRISRQINGIGEMTLQPS